MNQPTPRTVIGMAHNTGPADRELPPQAFFKPASSVVGPGEPIVLPAGIGVVEPEAELALIIGTRCRDLSPDDVPAAVAGWTVANDVTARDLQRTDPLWVRAKSYDTFTPLSPELQPGLPAPTIGISLAVDGVAISRARLGDLARNPIEILCYLSSFMTLEPGDVILTGAPGASVPLRPGAQVTVTVDGLAPLTNPVVAGRRPPGSAWNHNEILEFS